MNATTKPTLMTAIGLAVLLFAIQPAAANEPPAVQAQGQHDVAAKSPAGGQTDWWPCHNPAGTWLGSNDLGMNYLGTITPLDRWNRRFSVVFDGANDPTMGGYFPTAVDGVAVRGEMVKAGPDTYNFTITTYAVDDMSAIVVYGVISGSLVMTSETTFDLEMYIAFFSPDQDPFGSEPPLYGCMGPVPATYGKLPLLPPCEP